MEQGLIGLSMSIGNFKVVRTNTLQMKRMAMDNIKYTNRSIHIKLNYQKLRIINSMNLQSLVFDVKKDNNHHLPL